MKIIIEHNGKRLPRKLKKSLKSKVIKDYKDCEDFEIRLVIHPLDSVIHNGILNRIQDHRSTKTTT